MNETTPFGLSTVFAAGAAHIDRRGRSSEAFRPGASNPGRMSESVGGAVFNAVRAVAALGARIRLVSPRGGDAGAAIVADSLDELGVEDIAMTWLDRHTPTYTALLDETGELVGGIADMELYDLLRPRAFDRRHIREAVAMSDILLLDANLPGDTIERLIERAGARPVFAIGVSPAKVARLEPSLSRFAAIFLSRAEAGRIVGLNDAAPMPRLADLLLDAGCRRAVVTDGPRPAAIVANGETLWQSPPVVASVRDVTGAGDTLAGVAMLAFAGGLPFHEAVRFGMAAAGLHVSDGRRDGGLSFPEIRDLAASPPPATRRYPSERSETA